MSKNMTIAVFVGVGLAILAVILIYWNYTKKQTEIARQKALAAQNTGGQKTGLMDIVGAVGTGLSTILTQRQQDAQAKQNSGSVTPITNTTQIKPL